MQDAYDADNLKTAAVKFSRVAGKHGRMEGPEEDPTRIGF